jgi:hypothetical protein
MATPKSGIIPPGGYHFEDEHGRVEGSSYDDVAEQLLRFRVQNKLPLGMPLAEVVNYTCSRHPHFCHAPQAQVSVSKAAKPALSGRVIEWYSALYRGLRGTDVSQNYVDAGTANQRAKTCLSCPAHTEWRTGCGSCVSSARRIGHTYRAGRKVEYEDKLLACDIVGHDCATAVWVKAAPSLTPEQNDALPSHCWRKRL